MALSDNTNTDSLKKEIIILKNIVTDLENEIDFLLEKIQSPKQTSHGEIIAKLKNSLLKEKHRIKEKDDELDKTKKLLQQTKEILNGIQNSEVIILMKKDEYDRLNLDLYSFSKIKQGIEVTKAYIYSLKEEIKELHNSREEDIINTKTEYDESLLELQYRLELEEKRTSMVKEELSMVKSENRIIQELLERLSNENTHLKKVCVVLNKKIEDLQTTNKCYEDTLMKTNVKTNQETGDAYKYNELALIKH